MKKFNKRQQCYGTKQTKSEMKKTDNCSLKKSNIKMQRNSIKMSQEIRYFSAYGFNFNEEEVR